MKKILLIFLLLLFFVPTISNSAPLPSYIVINEETGGCGEFWPGDEDVYYILPDGWIDIEEYLIKEPDNNSVRDGECIEGVGECLGKFQCKINNEPESACWDSKEVCRMAGWCDGFVLLETKFGNAYVGNRRYETFCEQLGFEYISQIGTRKENIIKKDSFLSSLIFESTYIFIGIILILLVIIFLLVRFVVRRNRLK